MQKLITKILNFMKRHGVDMKDTEEEAVYHYGIEITLSSFCNIILVLLIGILFQIPFSAVMFLCAFVPLRMKAGGYHAGTYLGCNVFFGISCGITFGLYRFLQDRLTIEVILCVCLLEILFLWLLAPVACDNKPLTTEQRRQNKRKCLYIAIIESMTAIGGSWIRCNVTLIIVFAFALVDFLIITELIRRGGGQDEKVCG